MNQEYLEDWAGRAVQELQEFCDEAQAAAGNPDGEEQPCKAAPANSPRVGARCAFTLAVGSDGAATAVASRRRFSYP